MPTHCFIKTIHVIWYAIGVGNVSGKTTFAEIILIEYLCTPKSFSYYISPTFSQGRKCFKHLCQLLDGKGIITKANSSNLIIETAFGSTLQFFSFENITAVRGHTVKGVVVIDEAAFAYSPNEENPFASVILPTIKAYYKKNKVLVISTPKGKQGLFYELWNKALDGEEGFKYIQATIYDDELVSEEQIEQIKASIPPKVFNEEFEGKFLDSSITYFEGFEECFIPINHTYKSTWIGIDLSANGEDATVLTKINEKNEVEQFNISGTLQEKYKQIANIINNSINIQSVFIEKNGVGTPMIEEIKKCVYNKNIIKEWLTTNESKGEIINDLALSITKKEIYFNERTSELCM